MQIAPLLNRESRKTGPESHKVENTPVFSNNGAHSLPRQPSRLTLFGRAVRPHPRQERYVGAPSVENVGRPDQRHWLHWAGVNRVYRGQVGRKREGLFCDVRVIEEPEFLGSDPGGNKVRIDSKQTIRALTTRCVVTGICSPSSSGCYSRRRR